MGFLDKLKRAFKALGEKVKKLFRRSGQKEELEEEVLEESIKWEFEELREEEVEVIEETRKACEVQDLILVRDASYHERRKNRIHEISLYVYLERVPLNIELDEIAVRAFEVAVEAIEGGALAPLLINALSPLAYSVDSESAVYEAERPECLVAEVEVSINTRGRFRAYRAYPNVEVCGDAEC